MLTKEVIQLENDRFILIEVLDARRVKISTNFNKIQYEEIDGEIVSFNINNKFSFDITSTLTISINKTQHQYYIYSIQKLSSNSILLSTNYPTKTKQFILPSLGYNRESFQVDTFLEDVKLNKELNKLYLSYRFIKGELYNHTEKFLLSHPNFIKHTDTNLNHVQYEFDIPSEYLSDIKLFIRGKYSSFSSKLKNRILTFYGFKKGGTMYGILYKDDKFKEQLEFNFMCEIPPEIDLYDIPQREKEIINS